VSWLRTRYAAAAGGQLVQALAGVLAALSLAQLLQPRDFGVFVLVAAGLAIAVVMLTAGIQAAALIHAARSEATRGELHGVALLVAGVSALLVLAVVLLGGTSVGRVFSPSLERDGLFLAVVRLPLMAYLAVVVASLNGAGQVHAAARIGAVAGVATLAAPLAVVALGGGLEAALAGALVGSVVGGAYAWRSASALLGLRRPSRSWLLRDVTGLAIPMHIGTVAYWVMLRADAFILQALVGGPVVGVYALALTLSERVGLFTQPLFSVSAWRISGPDPVDARRATSFVARFSLAAGAVLSLAALVAARPFIEAFAGAAYADAVPPLALLVLGTALLPVWSGIGLYIVSQLRGAWLTAWLQVGVAAAAVGGYLVAVPLAGMLGAAAVSTLSYAALAAIGALVVRSRDPDSRAASTQLLIQPSVRA
jgi:O-antigen/teichoic acid export membrane protein